MKLASMSTLHVAGLADGRFDFTRGGKPASLVVIGGPPGSGKTALLEAIAATKEKIAPYGASPGREIIARDHARAKVTIDWWLDEGELAIAGGEALRPSEALFGSVEPAGETAWDDGLHMVLGRWSTDRPKVEYLHHPRAILPTSVIASASVSSRNRLGRHNAKFDGMVATILGWTDNRDKLEAFHRAFGFLCSSKRFAGIVVRGSARLLGFASTTKPDQPWVSLDELSASEHQAALFAATFTVLDLERSVVLIDVPEAALPSDKVVDFVGALTTLGEDNQLIVATSSRELQGYSEALVIDLGKV